MKYHVRLQLDQAFYQRQNLDYETLLQDLIVPFVNRQVVIGNPNEGGRTIMNMSAVFEIQVFKSKNEIEDGVLSSSDEGVDECTLFMLAQDG